MKSLLENTGQRKQCDHHSLLLGGIRVRVSQKLSAVAFWSWNLDVVVFQSWNLDVVTFRPLKKCLGISVSWLFDLGIPMSWYMCLHGLVFAFPKSMIHIINVDIVNLCKLFCLS